MARKLVPGTRIRVEKGRYEYRKGRPLAEFHVKYFSLADDSIRVSEQPTQQSRKNLELVFHMAWKIEVCA
jgi:hypothetical protein